MSHPLFQLGNLVITRGGVETLDQQSVLLALRRYIRGDWGDMDAFDKRQNDAAVELGNRILAAYQDSAGHKFWIITEWDRSYTTVLLPEEY